ncbi:MAG: hypothetical protein GY811_27435 [Myxococcales bacterium]|nr:hypothetical protein [Myxococcales bacterium]
MRTKPTTWLWRVIVRLPWAAQVDQDGLGGPHIDVDEFSFRVIATARAGERAAVGK